jgi:hypothetical protein
LAARGASPSDLLSSMEESGMEQPAASDFATTLLDLNDPA